jgi:phosphopantothenoylcysteine decarboxylase
MANVLLGVTGSVAAIRTPLLYRELAEAGHGVKVVATNPALYFFDPSALPAGVLHVDADEWPRRQRDERYQRDDPVLHIELRRWADLLLIAPLDANTLAKLASGLSDNCLTCVWRAWDPARPIVLVPAMNTFMWEHPLTRRHLRRLIEDFATVPAPAGADLDTLAAWLNEHCPRLQLIAPQSKRLACGDIGMGAMAEVRDIVAAVQDCLTPSQ